MPSFALRKTSAHWVPTCSFGIDHVTCMRALSTNDLPLSTWAAIRHRSQLSN